MQKHAETFINFVDIKWFPTRCIWKWTVNLYFYFDVLWRHTCKEMAYSISNHQNDVLFFIGINFLPHKERETKAVWCTCQIYKHTDCQPQYIWTNQTCFFNGYISSKFPEMSDRKNIIVPMSRHTRRNVCLSLFPAPV